MILSLWCCNQRKALKLSISESVCSFVQLHRAVMAVVLKFLVGVRGISVLWQKRKLLCSDKTRLYASIKYRWSIPQRFWTSRGVFLSHFLQESKPPTPWQTQPCKRHVCYCISLISSYQRNCVSCWAVAARRCGKAMQMHCLSVAMHCQLHGLYFRIR